MAVLLIRGESLKSTHGEPDVRGMKTLILAFAILGIAQTAAAFSKIKIEVTAPDGEAKNLEFKPSIDSPGFTIPANDSFNCAALAYYPLPADKKLRAVGLNCIDKSSRNAFETVATCDGAGANLRLYRKGKDPKSLDKTMITAFCE